MAPFDVPINTGNPALDQQQAVQFEQTYQAQGMTVQRVPSPAGGILLRVFPAGSAPGAGGGGGGGYPAAPPPGFGGAPAGGHGQPMGGQPMGGQPMGAQPGFGGPAFAGGPAPAKVKKPGFINSLGMVSLLGFVGALLALGIAFVLSNAAVGVLAGIGAGVGLVFMILMIVLGRPSILYMIACVGAGLTFGAVGGAISWFITHPSVRVDNQATYAMDIYVDGDKVDQVQAKSNKSVNMYKGERKLNWSKKGEKPRQKGVDHEIKISGKHLYNPGKTGCYWLVVDTYGSASSGDHSWGPQKIDEFYHFKKADNWFTDNPTSVKTKSNGAVKTAVQRNKTCMEFSDCGLEVRQQVVACQHAAIAADDEKAIKTCVQKGEIACKAKKGQK